MSDKQMTAVDFLIDKLKSQGLLIGDSNNLIAVIEAKEIEKQQIIDAYKSDLYPCSDEDAEQYYNETFK